MTTVSERVDIYSPEVYIDAPPHELFTELRRTQPVFWQDIPNQPGYWAVLKHKDVETVARHPRLYSASEGGVVLEDLTPERLEHMRGMPCWRWTRRAQRLPPRRWSSASCPRSWSNTQTERVTVPVMVIPAICRVA